MKYQNLAQLVNIEKVKVCFLDALLLVSMLK